MAGKASLGFLRPCLYKGPSVSCRAVYLRLYSASRKASPQQSRAASKANGTHNPDLNIESYPIIVQERIRELATAGGGQVRYPRIENDGPSMTCLGFVEKYSSLGYGMKTPVERVSLCGRIDSVRIAGSKLVFIDIVQDRQRVQVVMSAARVNLDENYTLAEFRALSRLLQRGDIISVSGHATRTSSMELSIDIRELPKVLSPSLIRLPTNLQDPNTRMRHRHVDYLLNKQLAQTIRLRSHIVQYLRDFLIKDRFLEVQTPVITDRASGAIARPFATHSTEFPDKELALRIAPEIWLKRLILGGIDRVFEIGPSFRNEGLDATHNPEFMSCEFYKSFANLEDLISMTENMFVGLARSIAVLQEKELPDLRGIDTNLFSASFKRLEFIPDIESALGESLPELSADDATQKLIELLSKYNISLPSSQTLPRLLDKLASVYLEPQCVGPTFISHHPACMAPLAKSFLDSKTNQVVSARVELFVQSSEVANMYEEENSPFEQRKKFIQQGQFRDDENEPYVDESYLQALETGLPPTGGFGCGIDRICMLFSGASKISDVLAFGNLRNVVNLGQHSKVDESDNASGE